MVFFGQRVAGLNPKTGHGVEMPLSKTVIPKALSTAPSSSLCVTTARWRSNSLTLVCVQIFFVSSYNNSECNNIFSFQHYQLILMNSFFLVKIVAQHSEKIFNKSTVTAFAD